MSKILYIEDELHANNILNLFRQYLSPKEVEKLSSPKARSRKFIKELLDKNPFVNVEYNFIKAIETVVYRFEDYSFFIIDRNLYGSAQRGNLKPEYDEKEVPNILNVELKQKCEGDYLFLLLLDRFLKYSNPMKLLENFYFLTAYSDEDTKLEINRSLKRLFFLFDIENHLIEKDQEEKINSFIENKINRYQDLVIKSEHIKVFEVFQKSYLSTNSEGTLLAVLKDINTTDTSKIEGYISNLRNIFQEILRKIVEIDKITIPREYYISGNLDVPDILDFLNGNLGKKRQYKPIKPEYFSNSHNLLSKFGFWKVCSEIAHGGKSGNRKIKYIPTKYTLPVLANIMMDFMIWFGGFMDKYRNEA